ncbi:hypothetical protein B4102_3310 [Heyndrickxia sporothermodurans]|uniref:Uncharacterized protein n=1 Tax=Heyndrickxia sporothermodurans TaxID=46224 RepID=A0A150KVP1_9BACI|nr:replication-relaxation family protein [Heyndrickxia sporothermodurans]KYD04161.1 hypothetical protein B4102_3310 [Heyndrickxia sporothermodurans]
MKKRDLDILNSLEKFKCLTRDQIAALHFSKNAYPHIAANNVLKRLRRDEYITANTDRSFQQYIYFLNPPQIKTDSQKIDHFLMIAQGYIDMMKFSPLNRYEIEPKIDYATFIPDVYCRWLDNDWFLEFQNSVYTVKQLYAKLDKYLDYYKKGYWENERVLIIGKVNMKFNPEDYPFKIKQIKSINELEDTINRFKGIKSSGGLKMKLG